MISQMISTSAVTRLTASLILLSYVIRSIEMHVHQSRGTVLISPGALFDVVHQPSTVGEEE